MNGNERDAVWELKWSTRFFWIVVSLHCLLWTLLPGLCHPGYKPDVIEQLFIGHEWVLASAKHPALPAMMLETANLLTGRAFLTPFLVSQICVLLAVWGVWRLGCSMLTPARALVASLSMLVYWYFTIESINYNQHMPLIAFWTLSIVFVHDALKSGKTLHWILAGVFIALAIWSKYPTGLLVLAFLIFFAFDSRARKTWRTPGPYLTTLTAFLLVVPLILWLLQHGSEGTFVLFYKMDTTLWARMGNILDFFFSQIGFFFFVMMCLCAVLGFPWRRRTVLSEDERWNLRYLLTMMLLPLLGYMIIGFLKPARLRPDFGCSIWPTLSIAVLLVFQSAFDVVAFQRREETVPVGDAVELAPKKTWYIFGSSKPLKAFSAALLIWEAGFIVAFFIQCFFSVHLVGHMRKFQFPMKELGIASERIWDEKVGETCPYVTGDWWLAGNAALHMEQTPTVHAFGQFGKPFAPFPVSSWSTDQDVNRYGGLVFWEKEDDNEETMAVLRGRFPDIHVLPMIVIPHSKAYYIDSAKIPPQEICLGIVYPKEIEPQPKRVATHDRKR